MEIASKTTSESLTWALAPRKRNQMSQIQRDVSKTFILSMALKALGASLSQRFFPRVIRKIRSSEFIFSSTIASLDYKEILCYIALKNCFAVAFILWY